MTRLALPLLAALLLTFSGACQSRQKTVFPAVEGVVVDVSSGTPVDEATISGDRTDETVGVDSDGRFSMVAVKARDTSIPLPVSGVYRDSAQIRADVDGGYAYAPADFLSTGDAAFAPVILFVLGWEAPYSAAGIPESCELTPEEAWALRFLAVDDRAAINRLLSENDEFTFALESWIDQTLVRKLPRRCDVQMPQLTRWLDEISAAFAPLQN